MKFAEISIVRLTNDVITTSGNGGFDYEGCGTVGCYNSAAPGDPCDDE